MWLRHSNIGAYFFRNKHLGTVHELTGTGENSMHCFAIVSVDSNLSSSAIFNNDLVALGVSNCLHPFFNSHKLTSSTHYVTYCRLWHTVVCANVKLVYADIVSA